VVGSGVNNRAYTAALSYANGPISTGIAYAKYQAQERNAGVNPVLNPATDTSDSSDWNAGFKYDFGVVAASVFIAQQKEDTVAINSANKLKFWALGIAAPIGANDTIKAGYGESKKTGTGTYASLKGKAWDIVYLHSLSKRSTVYAMYGNLAGSDDNYLDAGTYQQAFNVGLRHTF